LCLATQGKALHFAEFLTKKGWKVVRGSSGKVEKLLTQEGKVATKEALEIAAKEFQARPPNMSPVGSKRQGALNAAKGNNGVPLSQQPDRVLKNLDKRGNVQPGRVYEYDVPAPGGGKRTVRIRDDAGGHYYGPNDPQNRGPHFNDEAGNHYDYE
jgi:hypothetical protein